MTFDDWLTKQAEQRESIGLTRSVAASDVGRILVDLAGNDYLGLSRHPRVIAGAVAAAERLGGGAGASRLVSGTLSLHGELERDLAEFTGFPAALVFSTGYHANLSAITSLTDADTLVVSDAHNHASLIDAMRLSRATVARVPHNDVAAVEEALAHRSQSRALVVVESIYSVLGDAAPLVELAEVTGRQHAVLVADEAHALGVGGSTQTEGRGLLAALGLAGHPDVVATLTLSKALGAQGGAVLGSSLVREQLVNTARPFIYDTGLAPAAAGAAQAAVGVIQDEPARVQRVWQVAAALADACGVPAPAGAVLSVAMPGPREAVAAVEEAARQGLRVGCFRPPSTPDGISRLRLTAHAHLTDDEVERACAVLRRLVS